MNNDQMQVNPEQQVAGAEIYCADRYHTEPDWLPLRPLRQPALYHLSLGSDGFTGSDSVGPPSYEAYLNCSSPLPVAYAQPTESQHELSNHHSLRCNVTRVDVSVRPPAIISQPTPAVVASSTYLMWSIFNLFFCFWPLGLAAIIYSLKVGRANNNMEAQSHSCTACKLNIAASITGPIMAFILGLALGIPLNNSYSNSSSSQYTGDYYYVNYYYYVTR